MGKAWKHYILWAVLLLWPLVPGCHSEPAAGGAGQKTAKPAPVYEGTIVAVGDSLTAGLGVAEDQAYPAQLARKLKADGYNFDVVNAGISGETSSGALARIQWVITSLKPGIVILETGANDGLRGLDTRLLEKNLDRLLTQLQAAHIEVVLGGMRMPSNLGVEYTQAFAGIYPRLAREHRVTFMPFFLDGVAGQAGLNQPDNLHPTARGYSRLVDNLYPYVLKAIASYRAGRR
jgi:acyl-CoA thioesterase I